MEIIWCGLKIKENCDVLVCRFNGNFYSETLGCRKIKCVFRDLKWCFNASWGLKWLTCSSNIHAHTVAAHCRRHFMTMSNHTHAHDFLFWADSTRPIPHVLFILYIKTTQNTDFQNKAGYEFHNCCFCGNVTIIIVKIYWSLGHF